MHAILNKTVLSNLTESSIVHQTPENVKRVSLARVFVFRRAHNFGTSSDH